MIENRLIEGESEGPTATVWNQIFHQVFPSREYYITWFEWNSNDSGLDVFASQLVKDSIWYERKFLIVECKAPGIEGQEAFDEERLTRDLAAIATPEKDHRKFGAIAIGKAVRLYEYKATEGLKPLENDVTIYYFDRHCQTVTRKLEYIRQNL